MCASWRVALTLFVAFYDLYMNKSFQDEISSKCYIYSILADGFYFTKMQNLTNEVLEGHIYEVIKRKII